MTSFRAAIHWLNLWLWGNVPNLNGQYLSIITGPKAILTMKRLSLLTLCLLSFLGTDLLAQGIQPRILPARVEDALRFTNTDLMGTARFVGTGGSMTAIGVDVTTLHVNPAGIGWNRNSYATASVGFGVTSFDSQLRGNTGNRANAESNSALGLPNLGLVYVGESRNPRFPTLNFGFSLSRLADYNETISFSGSSEGSIIDAFVEDLNDDFSDPFRTDLIFQVDTRVGRTLLDPDDRPILFDDLGFFSTFDFDVNQGGQIDRNGTVERSGSMNEFAAGLGGNYDNKVLWGISLGIPFLNFSEVKTYNEVDTRNEITEFEDASFEENLDISGTGANFKLGVIILPSPQARISLSMQTPTFWTLEETFFTDFTYNYSFNDQALGGNAQSALSESIVNLRSPWRFNAGLGYLVGKTGFLSADVGFVNFAGNQFSFDDFTTLDENSNEDIDATLNSSINIRVGGELNLKPIQVRAGVGYSTVPIIDPRFGEDENQLTFSGGIGYNAGKLYFDVGARFQGGSGFYAPYRSFNFDPQVVDTDRTRITGVITVGYRGFGL